MVVTVQEAKLQLSALLRHIEEHPADTVTITRRGEPIADLTPHRPKSGHAITLGVAAGKHDVPGMEAMRSLDAEVSALMET